MDNRLQTVGLIETFERAFGNLRKLMEIDLSTDKPFSLIGKSDLFVSGSQVNEWRWWSGQIAINRPKLQRCRMFQKNAVPSYSILLTLPFLYPSCTLFLKSTRDKLRFQIEKKHNAPSLNRRNNAAPISCPADGRITQFSISSSG